MTSLMEVARCVGLSGTIAVRRDLAAVARSSAGECAALQPPSDGSVSVLRVMRHLEWCRCSSGCAYQKMPVPLEHRAPSGEEAQILIDGIAERVTLFMGQTDWELDWHIYPRLDASVRDQLARIGTLNHDTLFCEFMVVDDSHDETFGGRTWYSADMDPVLLLRPVPGEDTVTASEHWSHVAADARGAFGGDNVEVADIDNAETRDHAGIIGGRVYLQGAFVNDDDHLEIHPLDSIAYAREAISDEVLAAKPTDDDGQDEWPVTSVKWRVAAVTNAGGHRVNNCDFLRKRRTTVWYLDLPSAARSADASIVVTEATPGFLYPAIQHVHLPGSELPPARRIADRQVASIDVQPSPDGRCRSREEFPVDPTDPHDEPWPKLKVTITMEEPADCEGGPWNCGGYWLRDYNITVLESPEVSVAAPSPSDRQGLSGREHKKGE